MKSKIDIIKKAGIFKKLDEKELKKFSSMCEFVRYKKGQVIFEKNDSSRHFFIVDTGKVRIINKTDDNDENVLAYFIPDEIFGEFDLFEDDPRTATAIADENSRLLAFPKKDDHFEKVYNKHPNIFVKICHNLIVTNAGRIRHTNRLVFEKTSWIDDLKNLMLVDKLTGFYNRNYLEDEFPSILAQSSGKVSFLVVKPDNFKIINDTLGHEAGDIALKNISNTVRSNLGDNEIAVRYRGNEFIVIYFDKTLNETVIKAEELHSLLSSIDTGKIISDKSLKLTYSIGISLYPDQAKNTDVAVELAFAKMFEQRNLGGDGILSVNEAMDENINFLKSINAFSSLHISELREIIKYLTTMEVKGGDIICREGDEGKELYIIESGKAAVTIKLQDETDKQIAEFSPGDFFGEMAIFENEKRSATCTAIEDGKVLILYKKDFEAIMKKKPVIAIKVMRKILDITSGRLSSTSKFVSEMVRWGDEASRRAITDELTGVYNRRYLDTSLEECFNNSVKENRPICLIMADMDFFREVNEAYSHETGDKYIVEVAGVFRACLRETDIIARYGGDEFTIILPDTPLSMAGTLAENIRSAVEKIDFLKQFEGPEIKLSISQGVAGYPDNCKSLDKLKELADKALYKAKEAGRNMVSFVD